MKRIIVYLVAFIILCTSCWWVGEDVCDNPYPSEQHPDYKSKLYYTTTDGLPIDITRPDIHFGVDILDMSYVDGQGEITFDGIVRTIRAGAFEDYDNLSSLVLPDSTRIIYARAFKDCDNLEDIVLPDSLKTIGAEAFVSCDRLNSITIPAGVSEFQRNIFLDCSELREFRGQLASSDGRTIVSNREVVAFAPAGLDEYTLPIEADAVGEGAFYFCNDLKRVVVPDNYTTLHINAFAFCSSLEEITFGEGVQAMDNEVLLDCKSLKSIYVRAITPPAITPTSLCSFDFTTYTFVFLGCDIYVPLDAVEAYKSAETWSDYASYIKGYNFDE